MALSSIVPGLAEFINLQNTIPSLNYLKNYSGYSESGRYSYKSD